MCKESSLPSTPDYLSYMLRALALYALAEFQSGHCTTILVDADTSGAFCIADDGRGHAIARTVADLPYLSFV